MNIIIFDCLFSFTSRVMALDMSRLDAKLGEIWGVSPSFDGLALFDELKM